MAVLTAVRPEVRSVPELFFRQAARLGPRVALRRKELGIWRRVSWEEYARNVRWVAHALLSLGVQRGEPVAVLGENRPEWLYSDLGIQSAGAVTVGIYPTSSPEQVHYILDHAGCRVAIVENEEQLDKVLEVRPQLPRLERVVVMDREGLRGFSDPLVTFFDDFLEQGRAHAASAPRALDDRLEALQPSDVALLLYTSGTTGPPKGAMITHGNILWAQEANLRHVFPGGTHDEVLSYLPLAHIAERSLSVFAAVYAGYTVNFAENLDTVPQNLREVRPTIFFAVPRIWEKLHAGVVLLVADADWPKRAAFAAAVAVGRRYAQACLDRRRPSLPLRLAYRVAQAAVLRPLRHRLGLDRVRVALCSAAPVSPDVLRFFWSIGLQIREIYAQTESTAVGTVHPVGDVRLGTKGKPVPGVELRIASDGEILLRGPHVFAGYFRDPELTARTLEGGWLHTGDVGYLDPDGNLVLTDRKKDIFINAYGKNIAPQYIENKLKFSPYIADAVVIGDGRKYLVALIVIDEETVSRWAQDRRIPFTTFADLTRSPEVRRLIAAEVDAVNRTLSSPEQVRRFALLPKRLYQEDGEVTPTMKVKRKTIMEKYADVIAGLYAE
ncbi:MAG: AMP-binding protein [Armatimonadota bacterium]|nr:AMP-binding protein [Armatimonadota bacterium]MDR7401650.1 AMP-binding protein [Armatimonadota bacterium]MDR7403594.1 AMP-binding protein [Armatimonadota bacterium]MDR7437796.1 AMP-binding protein [Armatimonadota bacterium]MDR7471280.1 AMP-binding protein [Armatimonadota bacterium]